MPPSKDSVTLIAAALVTSPADAGSVVVKPVGVLLDGGEVVFVLVWWRVVEVVRDVA